MTKIEYVEVLNLGAVNNLDGCIRISEQYPFNTVLKGQVGELIVKTDETLASRLSQYLDEISQETGIPRDKIRIKWHKWVGDKEPDFYNYRRFCR